jgi:UDP-N-acetylmuramyl pentapeptide phosphotransferase/UDP-N-acetylglucosamine-1-phosphate transferase
MIYFYIFLLGIAVNLLIVLYAKKHDVFIDSAQCDKPQRFHERATPRIGGISIYLATLFLYPYELGKVFLVISSFPFFAGALEDLTGKISARFRFLVSLFAAIAAIYYLDACVTDVYFFKLPYLLGFLFSVLAIAGVTNSINIIDGLNGLASGSAMVILGSLAFAAYLVGDYDLFFIILVFVVATFSFFLWVFPYGKIFLGDGGAYYLGFSIAVLSILLVNRNSEISAWFPLAVSIFPVWEVLFSIYRRRIVKKVNAMRPDRLHLHSLVFKRLRCSNAQAAAYILFFVATFNILNVFLMKSPFLLILSTFAFIVVYSLVYKRIINFKNT